MVDVSGGSRGSSRCPPSNAVAHYLLVELPPHQWKDSEGVHARSSGQEVVASIDLTWWYPTMVKCIRSRGSLAVAGLTNP